MATAIRPFAINQPVPVPTFNKSVAMSLKTGTAFSSYAVPLISRPLSEVAQNADDAACTVSTTDSYRDDDNRKH